MSVLEESAEAATPPPLRKNRDFLLLWLGAGMSMLGARVSAVAYPLLLVFDGGSVAAAGVVGFAALLPTLLLQLPAGVLVDRWDRRRTMIWCDVAGLTAIGSVAIALFTGHLWVPHLMAAAFVEGSAVILYRLSERAAIRNVVHQSHLMTAYARNEARGRAAGLLGQPLGSGLFTVFRWLPFGVTALTHLIALVLLLGIRTPLQAPRTIRQRNLRAEVVEGITWLFRQRFLRAALLLVSCSNVLFQIMSLSLIVIIKESGGSPALLGVIAVISGTVGVLGAISASWFVRRVSPAVVLISAFTAWAGLMSAVAFTANPFILGALFGGMSFAGALLNVTAGAYQVQATPDELQGRVGSVAGMLASGANSIGPLIAGVVLAHFGTFVTVLGAGITMVLTAAAAAISPAVRSADRPVPLPPRGRTGRVTPAGDSRDTEEI
ncbi:MFS transporter [Actinoplanes auranticolor]|uniref:MFS transporter n=1 Tax=Actinoplanes auranticolor TaxID=47988 RepID=A0A919SX99_9ACTN|nr:MFS transporter [Actinoplanes auranticolor]GIM80182.1 MFS transporter [Actinoplanes auranticolor]